MFNNFCGVIDVNFVLNVDFCSVVQNNSPFQFFSNYLNVFCGHVHLDKKPDFDHLKFKFCDKVLTFNSII